jgi:hypothetical protein
VSSVVFVVLWKLSDICSLTANLLALSRLEFGLQLASLICLVPGYMDKVLNLETKFY